MKYLLWMIGLGVALLGASEWQKTDWKKIGIISDYNCKRCIDGYSYQGWRFTQTAQLGIYHPVVSIPQSGSEYCDHQCLAASDDPAGETIYYDAIGDMRAYRRGNDVVAVWAYRHASGGSILSDGYYYRCIVKDGEVYKEGKIHEIPGPDWLVSHEPEECGMASEKPRPLLSPKESGSGAVSLGRTFHYKGRTQDNLVSTLTLKVSRDGTIGGIYTVHGKWQGEGKPCWPGGRIPYHGYVTGAARPAAKGRLEAAHVWCPGDPNSSGMDIPSEPFDIWYEKGRGLIMDIGNQHYRVVYPTPPIDPFAGGTGNASQTVGSEFPAGKWQTTFGTMTLRVQNDQVSGTYTHDHGRITGTMRGRQLVCQWFEAPTYRPVHDAGECYFDFSEDGRSFTGKWRYGYGTGHWDGDWTGQKIEKGRNGQ